MLGERAACERALSHAETSLGKLSPTDAAIDLYSPSQLGRLAGSCYLFLSDAPRAIGILESTAGALTDRSKSRTIVLGNLALAYVRHRQLELAADTMHRAMDMVQQTWGGGGLTVIFGAAREMRPWRRENVVRDAYDRLLTLMAA